MKIDGQTLDDIIETFDMMDDWEDRYRLIIDLGRNLPKLDEGDYNDINKVRGCTSQVWLIAKEDGDKLNLKGDSDAHIVKGLVAILLLIFSGKSRADILATDAKAILGQLGLADHLSPMRTNGLFSMVERIGNMAKG
jgi:cysteine desulfuration protein SufE